MQQITDYEVSRVLERAITLTGKADKAKIGSKIAGMRMITLDGKRIPLMNKRTGRWMHFSDAKWAAINAKKKQDLARLIAARGLSAQSWYLLALQLGFEVKAPAYVKGAIPSKREAIAANKANVSFTRHNSGQGNYGLEIVNKMPILRFNPPAGLAALFSAIAGRIGFFRKNLEKGVFDDATKAAAKYRGIQVR